MKALIKKYLLLLLFSAPLIAIAGYYNGRILTLQSSAQLDKIGAEVYTLSMTGLSTVKEVGPVLLGLYLAIFYLILSILGFKDKIDKKILAKANLIYLLIATSLFYFLICSFSILGGRSISTELSLRVMFDTLSIKDVAGGVVKALFFALIIWATNLVRIRYSEDKASNIIIGIALIPVNLIFVIIADVALTFIFYHLFKT